MLTVAASKTEIIAWGFIATMVLISAVEVRMNPPILYPTHAVHLEQLIKEYHSELQEQIASQTDDRLRAREMEQWIQKNAEVNQLQAVPLE